MSKAAKRHEMKKKDMGRIKNVVWHTVNIEMGKIWTVCQCICLFLFLSRTLVFPQCSFLQAIQRNDSGCYEVTVSFFSSSLFFSFFVLISSRFVRIFFPLFSFWLRLALGVCAFFFSFSFTISSDFSTSETTLKDLY